MPEFWKNTDKISVSVEELVPEFWKSKNTLSVLISRNKNKSNGIKVLQRGGRNRNLLIDFDSLPIKVREALEDPREIGHNLMKYYSTDSVTIDFYSRFRRPNNNHMMKDEQNRYVINASVLIAVIQLRELEIKKRLKNAIKLDGLDSFLCNQSNSFNDFLAKQNLSKHNLPTHPIRFKQVLNQFEKPFQYEGVFYNYDYESIIKDSEGQRQINRIKITDRVLEVLQGLFSNQKHKPTATEIYKSYEAFLSGYAEVYDEDTGEIYNPKEFPKISISSVKKYLAKWENRSATHKMRSGDRQKYMEKYKPHHQLERPKYAGSLISIDDRNPPFKDLSGKRVWFYNGLDVASGCITVFVYGKTKEELVLNFYRQMIRNYTEWGLNLPYELEAESSLNMPFTKTFLQEGYLFSSVRIEANNARGKRIERDNGILRYGIEKKRAGWIARPSAKSESNQAGSEKVQLIPYDEIIENAIEDIFELNNSKHMENKDLSRWEYFLENQNPNLTPTNWKAILPYLGHYQETSCQGGYVKLQGKKRALAMNGKISLGSELINYLIAIEGKDIDVYWLDDNLGNVLKAVAFHQERFICEIQEMPKYNRAKIERTEADEKARELQSSYVSSVEGFINKQQKALKKINIVHKQQPQPQNGFFIPGMKRKTFVPDPETVETVDIPDDESYKVPTSSVNWRNSFFK